MVIPKHKPTCRMAFSPHRKQKETEPCFVSIVASFIPFQKEIYGVRENGANLTVFPFLLFLLHGMETMYASWAFSKVQVQLNAK